MSIYRGSGGSGDANTDATVNEVTELVQDAIQYKDEAATSASNAATSASNASTSESNASTSETNASSSASDAATSETNAATSEANAATSATSASTSASSASTSATAAQTAQTSAETAQASAETAETNASASATSASSSASTATTQAGIATTKASEASTSATNAATSETNAGNSASAASTSATNAANSASTASTAASNASTSESNASTSETNAAASATSASSSASSASSSASSAASSATTATTKASEAATSASNASTSETNASNSASSASTSATNASTSETNAATSATNAASFASAAATSATEAAASAASIDTSSFVVKSNNLSDLDSASSALTNLGIANHDDITVDGSGKVGVGTSSPFSDLHLSGSTAEPSTSGNMADNGLTISNGLGGRALQVGVDDTNSRSYIQAGYVNNSNAATHLSFLNGATESMRIDSSGNVGIGTSSPEGKVHAERASGSAGWSYATKATGVSNQSGFFMTASNNFECVLRDASNNLSFITNNGNNLVSFVDGTERMRIDPSGNVGIGTSSPSERLHVAGVVQVDGGSGYGHIEIGGTSGAYIDLKAPASDDYDARILTTGSGLNIVTNAGIGGISLIHEGATKLATTSTGISVTGNITASGNVTAYSDIKLKDNIEKIDDALSKVNLLGGYTFDRTDVDIPRQTGVIAQEVQAVLPEAVTETSDGTLTVAYGNMMGLMIQAIKELKAEIDELKGAK